MKTPKITIIEKNATIPFALQLCIWTSIVKAINLVICTSREQCINSIDNVNNCFSIEDSTNIKLDDCNRNLYKEAHNKHSTRSDLLLDLDIEVPDWLDSALLGKDFTETTNSDIFNLQTIDNFLDTNPSALEQLCNDRSIWTNLEPDEPMADTPTVSAVSQELNKISPNSESIQESTSTIRKRKLTQDKEGKKKRSRSKIFKLDVIKNSDQYKIFIKELHEYKLSMLKESTKYRTTAPLLFGIKVDIEGAELNLKKSTIDAINKSKNIWIALHLEKKDNIQLGLGFIRHLSNCPAELKKTFKDCGLTYYEGVFIDLSGYLTKQCKFCYNEPVNHLKSDSYTTIIKPYNITLGDIYIKKDINLLWHAESLWASSISRYIQNSTPVDTEELQKDLDLKRKLLLILSIPEIYEDLFYMQYDEINLVKDNILFQCYNKASMRICNLFCIIEYLYGSIHSNNDIVKKSYINIKANMLESILYGMDSIQIYQLVYKVFTYFYRYSMCLYKINTNLYKEAVRYPKNSNSNYLSIKQYTPRPDNDISIYRGAATVMLAHYNAFTISFKYSNKDDLKPRFLDNILYKTIECNNIQKNIVELSYSNHYHVQLVDNRAHRVHVIHLPFFVGKKDNVITYHYIHTIETILEYIQKITHLCLYTKYTWTNNIYPFKYNRKSKTWSIITLPVENKGTKKGQNSKILGKNSADMDKTIEEMDRLGFDIVFYYIQENIEKTAFVFAQFNPIGVEVVNAAYKENQEEAKKLFNGYEPNVGAPRIPLFLSKLTISAVHSGSYVLKSEEYETKNLLDYQDLVPIEFSNSLDSITEKKDQSLTIIDILKKNRHEIHYYSDFCILDKNTPYEDYDCYAMEIQQIKFEYSNIIKILWIVKKQFNIGEYTNYELCLLPNSNNCTTDGLKKMTKRQTLSLFLDMLQRKHVSQDMLCYGTCIYTRKSADQSFTIPLTCPEMKTRMNGLLTKNNKMRSMLSPTLKENIKDLKAYINQTTYIPPDVSKIHICVKNINYTKSKLGLHYNILNAVL
ncbi:hypothetical protein NEPAR06_1761 [Nematocida parisii]|uniref:uncharacterized protein n=1 Tax=Nematocida parisii (strain ERTm1 / ATCC PRA-289) TaxID=881290 RepID=UPI000264B9D5|nr:uncharacterized protein NEPG_01343 [Nematocida parisii ERTm1]EIJ93771.1 hypothetical protein NEPG_01343 [Nematocida parisii ERTm1]KAI5146341.1 hypothetical protein NEPAR07_2306 [Nematocida parisii]KAI5155360.1 hypothetical protein NEPAR06_1761 [Nematocida parisii]KAI5158524.1 hypothetical protein NEPAR05_2057 [Nematocida parisii]|eukprot:XP_013059171.1 hypothetical protein NEPG_01343 [Nematocida parisii ERTm1]